MNTKSHVVTIPIADYNELIDALTNSNSRFKSLKESLQQDILELQKRTNDKSMQMVMCQIIHLIDQSE